MNKLNMLESIEKLDAGSIIELCNGKYNIVKEDFDIIEKGIDQYSFAGDQNIKVAVCCTLNDLLIKEGIVRDIVRKVQNLRKELDFEVNDRVLISLKCTKHIYKAIEENSNYFKNETLCKQIKKVEKIEFNSFSFNLESEVVEIGIKKL